MPEKREIVQDDGLEYEIRTVAMPDGTEGYLACVPGSFDHMTDEEIAEKIRAVLPDWDEA
ncbi:hypothetical protein [Streptomyces sp. ME19-01-6]|uniref:hypothetical protein n=1 Tax=Streptomyces sp. ME19-01-6 TaxID=3028686 RepID=UPI0029AF383F|nr:hypothetical protein [Streptomyces sp. ME19-01-6]MDX3232965.1 hypothetical protein [Streptomyces sp. ME19-01-6]